MILIKEAGLNRKLKYAFLIPVGSAVEKRRGISHLMEHILISNLYRFYPNSIHKAFTTEDYIFFLTAETSPKEFLNIISSLNIEFEELEEEKTMLINEINEKILNPEELFFKKVWKGTVYEKSPLGDATEIKKVTCKNLIYLKKTILKLPFYEYSRFNRVSFINSNVNSKGNRGRSKFIYKKNMINNNSCYKIYYFKGDIEGIFLLEKILQKYNKEKHIQLSSKRKLSALIVEDGISFPILIDFYTLGSIILSELKMNISEIKNNFSEKALNELESIYFYNKQWSKRVELLYQTNLEQLFNLGQRLIV